LPLTASFDSLAEWAHSVKKESLEQCSTQLYDNYSEDRSLVFFTTHLYQEEYFT